MIELALVCTRDSTLYEQVQFELLDDQQPLCRGVDPRVKTVADLQARTRTKSPGLIIIDASTPSDGNSGDGESGKAVLDFLRQLRADGSRTPAIVLLPHKMEDIEAHCASSKFDYYLNISNVGYDALKVALQRVGSSSETEQDHDYAIEVVVENRTWSVELFRDGKFVRKKDEINRNPERMIMYARDFRKWKMLWPSVDGNGQSCMRPSQGWQVSFRAVGEVLYRELLFSLLRDDLEDIQRTPKGLQRTSVRFRVTNDLFAVPFEALYDASADRFLCVVSPIVRRILRESPVRGPNEGATSGDLDILFVKAQVEGKLKLVDDSDRSVVDEQWFDPLHNLDTEEKYFGEMHNKTGARGRTLVNVLAEPEAGRSFADTLEQALKERHYDFVHFAGHSYTTADGRTFLILPDKRPDRVVGLPIESFARWAGKAGVRFTYLSSCRGGSWEGVRTMVDNGVPQVLGFRWDVEDDKAAHFAQVFYDGLLKNSGSFASAYRDACEKLHDESSSTNPIWASPVMIIQSDDWWCRTAGERDVSLSRAA